MPSLTASHLALVSRAKVPIATLSTPAHQNHVKQIVKAARHVPLDKFMEKYKKITDKDYVTRQFLDTSKRIDSVSFSQ